MSMALFQGETTTWEDVQIRLGNFAERDAPSPSAEAKFRETMQRADGVAKQDFVNSLLGGSEANPQDDEMATIRRSRLAQLLNESQQTIVRRITKEAYSDEVTEGSKSAVIVVMMDRKGGDSFMESECRKTANEWVTEVAPRKGLQSTKTRFYVGDIDDLIGPNFPDNSLPFAVVYANGKCQSQLQKATGKGIITAITAIAKDFIRKDEGHQYDPEDDMESRIRREIAARRRTDSSGSEDESDSETQYQRSKGYASLDFERNVLRFR